MDQTELLRDTVQTLDRLGIAYALVGSFASGAWGESRFTQDIDIVVALTPVSAVSLCQAFSEPEFYVSQTAALEAVEQNGQFNVIHPGSGNKIDFMIAGSTAWSTAQLQRAHRVPVFPDVDARIAAPEDVILGKLIYYEEGGSEKHLRDIASILMVSGELIDKVYLEHFAEQFGVMKHWRAILERVEQRGRSE